MRTIIAALTAFLLSATSASGQCSTPIDTFYIALTPAMVEAGQTVYITTASNSSWPRATQSRFRVTLNDTPIPVLSFSDSGLTAQIPPTVETGTHRLNVCVIDGPWAELTLEVERMVDTLDTKIDKTDPDPRTQNGPRQDLSLADRRILRQGSRTYPNGGFGGTLPCEKRHVIDGKFTEHKGHQREWSGILPMIGRFSNLYLDFCPNTRTMYLMNDWLIGRGRYQSNCYNLFGFTTGNGREVWVIKVTHDTLRPVIVELNGNDVTDDTTIVLGGAFSVGPSPSDTTPHTMYEFGVRVSAGLFLMPEGHDPVQYIPSTTTSLECDQGGVPGYGLIREPQIRMATFSDTAVTVEQAQRYIPTSGVVGLELEPNVVSGEVIGNSIRYRSGTKAPVSNVCNGVISVDGQYGPEEWLNVPPAKGRFSDMYAKFCNGTLHILNDWVYANGMPDNRTCYNLFELFTGNGAEHWGIWVWQDPTRRPTVYRNGVNVSDDTSIVRSGMAGWGTSPRSAEPHALYEFTIRAKEGAFVMMFCDPGPSSYCSSIPASVNERERDTDGIPALYPNPTSDGAFTLSGLKAGDRVQVYDLNGRRALADMVARGSSLALVLPQGTPAGRYSVQVLRGERTFELALLLQK